MARGRTDLFGPPDVYWIHSACALAAPLLGDRAASAALLTWIERLRPVFALRCYAYAIQPDGYHLVVQIRARTNDADEDLQRRWATTGSRSQPAPHLLRRRLTSLSGFMQTLNQGFSRRFHRRHGGRGSIWEGRYHSCLLADDSALLAAVSWIEEGLPARTRCVHRSRDPRAADGILRLNPLPLRELPGGMVLPGDRAPLGAKSALPGEEGQLLERSRMGLSTTSLQTYGRAIRRAWALGQPESLTDAADRLGRQRGRGRHRRLHELDDEWGLCGIWG